MLLQNFHLLTSETDRADSRLNASDAAFSEKFHLIKSEPLMSGSAVLFALLPTPGPRHQTGPSHSLVRNSGRETGISLRINE